MTGQATISWDGEAALGRIAGPSAIASPVQAIFLAHRVQATGRLWMTRGLSLHGIDFQEGAIVGCTGFTDLVDGVTGDRQYSLPDWAAAISSVGQDPISRETIVARALCRKACQAADDGDWMVNFVSGGSPSAPGSVPETAVASLITELKERNNEHEVRTWLESIAKEGLVAVVPGDSERSQWGLGETEARLLNSVEQDGSVGSLFVEMGPEDWKCLAVLRGLGLVAKKAIVAETAAVAPEAFTAADDLSDEKETAEAEQPAPVNERRRGDRRAETTSRDVPTRPPEERRRGDRRAESTSRTRDGRRRRVDPRRIALKRAPHESPEDRIEQHLHEAYEVLQSVSPEFLFRIRKEEHLDKMVIEQRYHKMVTRYHPDRYRVQSQSVKVLAEACFTAVSDAFHRIQEPEYVQDLRIRIIEKETGKKVVTDKTRATAKVDFAKADALFKQKRFDESHTLAGKAREGDPDRWQYAYLWYRSGYRSGKLSLDEVEPGILGLQGMTTIEKADQLYTLGEMLLKEGSETKAYKLFHQAVSLDEKNVGANRRLRLRDRRKREEEKASSPGLFGGLFRGKNR